MDVKIVRQDGKQHLKDLELDVDCLARDRVEGSDNTRQRGLDVSVAPDRMQAGATEGAPFHKRPTICQYAPLGLL